MKSLKEIKIDIDQGQLPYYVYLIYKPDGTPFYVGKGRSNRISAHEAEARYYKNGRIWKGMNLFKINTINKILGEGGEVQYSIDSWHNTGVIAGNRELELVDEIGRRVMDSGPLTNIRNGGDLMTEEDRFVIGQRIRQYYIDNPEARVRASERLTKYYIDNPEKREEISLSVKEYCKNNPEFIESLQESKNSWIENNPEEYLAVEEKRLEICQSENHREKVSEIMRQYYVDNPERLEMLREQGLKRFQDPEAIKHARRCSIENNSHESILDWLASDDPDTVRAKEAKFDNHSKWMSDFYQTEEGKLTAKEAAKKRNKTVRTDHHRSHMSKKTAEYNNNNPEEHEARRKKAKDTIQKLMEEKQRKLLEVQDRLFAEGKINKKVDFINHKRLYTWKKKGLVPKDFCRGLKVEI